MKFGITYGEMIAVITILWILYRAVAAKRTGEFSLTREARMLLAYICLIVVARFVYFPLRRVNGRIGALMFDSTKISPPWVNLVPFVHLLEVYDGWQINIIGNIAMFIPVGFVWPICFKKLDTTAKTVLACAGLSLLIELTQLLFFERNTDIDDLILNTAGAMIGAVLWFRCRRKILRKATEQDREKQNQKQNT